MSDRLFIGIDNGISGVCAALALDGLIVHLGPLPVTKIKSMTVLDATAFETHLRELCTGYRPHILIEPAQMFSAGKKALASTWVCWGALRAILEISGYVWEPINLQKWQKEMFAGHVRAIDQDSKKASILVAKRLFPQACLVRTLKSRTADSGLADALLIAEFGRRKR